MNKRNFFLILFLTLAYCGNSQSDYSTYLDKAMEKISVGDCEGAQRLYNVYKELTKRQNETLESSIEDCLMNRHAEGGILNYSINNVSFRMMYVEGGSFRMGSEDVSDCKPVHTVSVSDFWMGETEVTQELWEAVMGTTIQMQRNKNNPNSTILVEGASFPMYYVTFLEAEQFCSELNKLLKKQLPTGYYFSLPTEAEWEYAAKGGNKSQGYIYSGSNNIEDVAWYGNGYYCSKGHIHKNSRGQIHPIKKLKCNELGLYDMSGNMKEYCRDYYQEGYYSSSPEKNPCCENPDEKSYRVTRGGSWYFSAEFQKTYVRFGFGSESSGMDTGFRIVLVSH